MIPKQGGAGRYLVVESQLFARKTPNYRSFIKSCFQFEFRTTPARLEPDPSVVQLRIEKAKPYPIRSSRPPKTSRVIPFTRPASREPFAPPLNIWRSVVKHLGTLALATCLASAGAALAQDGPNLLQNAGFEKPLKGTYATFGNAFRNLEYAESGIASLKMYGCFCSDFNGNGAVNTYALNGASGQIYRIGAQALTASFDSIAGTGNWCGIKLEFKNSSGTVIGVAEQRIVEGSDAELVEDAWIPADFLSQAPAGTTSMTIVPVFLQAGADEGGSAFLDSLVLAESSRDPDLPLINGGFDNGVDYNYGLFPYYNGWNDQYGNHFFDDANYLSPPFSAGTYGNFPDFDGDGNCDPGGVSGLNQTVPFNAGDPATLTASAFTPSFDSIIGTGNFVLAKIDWMGADPNTPISSLEALLLSGSSDQSDTWYTNSVSGVAPVGTQNARIVVQIVQPNCESGSVRIDDVVLAAEAAPPVNNCPGDFNDSGTVDGSDFGSMLASWGNCGDCEQDLNLDGFVNGADIGAFLALWGDCPDQPDPSGSCCVGEDCSEQTQAECANLGGTYGGDGTVCDADTCSSGGGGSDCGDCDSANSGPGCSDTECRDAVCASDSFCCSIQWDASCASKALSGNFPECDCP